MAKAIILFGATGDLSRKKILPALNHLLEMNKLAEDIFILGVATRKLSKAEFIKYTGVSGKLVDHLDYISGDFNDMETYAKLKAKIGHKEQVIFYLATPPSFYKKIILSLKEVCISCRSKDQQRIIIEKPFGVDLATAKDLNVTALSVFKEDQIYRIDHYLGKETVQNISAFRFFNGIFESLWNRQYIDYVTITVAEKAGVENRGKYFEEAGVLRDIVQNHLLQLLALIAMEPPAVFDSDQVRDEKVKVFRSIKAVKKEDVFRGQYIGYLNELNVAADSKTDTYVALKLFVDNWRWAGVPFYIRAGKKMLETKTEIVISLKQPPLRMFNMVQENVCGYQNQIVLKLQPERSMAIKFGAKKPGVGMDMMPVTMDFNYATHFKPEDISEYERLILDCFKGDLTLFARNDAVEACWKIIDPIEQFWKNEPDSLIFYEAQHLGQKEAENLFENTCHHW